MASTLCRSCSASIRWIRMDTGKAMPVDAVATPKTGNVAARQVGDRWTAGYVVTARTPLRDGFTLFTAHWASCDMRRPQPRTPQPRATSTPLF